MLIKTVPLQKIQKTSADAARCTQSTTFNNIDFSLPFIHEDYTQLYYTPFYRQITRQQKLRYNQLFGIRVNEQFMFFESEFTNRILRRLHFHPAVKQDKALNDCLSIMIKEEDIHHDIFWTLNQYCLPKIYSQQSRYFTRISWFETLVYKLSTYFPANLTFLIWFIVAMEEYSIALSRDMITQPQTQSLGALDHNFVEVHAQHIKDEARHVQIDVHLIQTCLDSSSQAIRSVNARLFAIFINDIIVPKRSGLAVIRHWVSEFPELKSIEKNILQSTRDLKDNPVFKKSLFNRKMMPFTFALFDRYPEYHRTRDRLCADD